METPATHTPVGDQIPLPHVITPAEPPDDFNPVSDHGARSTLFGFIHQRCFHLSLIRALDGIELHAPSVPQNRNGSRARCRSCGAPIPHPPLCARCRTQF